MNIPEEKSKSHSTAQSLSFNMNVPLAISLSSSYLEKNGWTRIDKMKWFKDGWVIKYDGATWLLNDKEQIQFVHELPENRNKKEENK